MIRVFRTRPGERLRSVPAEREPDATAASVALLLEGLATRRLAAGLSATEADTLALACARLAGAEAADIVLAAGGGLFWTKAREAEHPTPPASAAVSRPHSWMARERDVAILLSDRDVATIQRTQEALCFLGYKAETIASRPWKVSSVVEAVRASRPLALFVGSDSWLALEEEISVARVEVPMAVVSLARRDAPGPRPTNVDATLEVPLQIEDAASAIDPVLARVRAARASSLKAT